MLPFGLPLGVTFFVLLVGPCLPIVGKAAALLLFVLAAGILGGGTDGGMANVNGVFAGVDGGVGGLPTDGFTSFDDSSADVRDFLNMFDPHRPCCVVV